MAASSYNLHITQAVSKIMDRVMNLNPTQLNKYVGPSPAYSNDFPIAVAFPQNCQTSQGIHDIIDVQPDFRNIILFINYYITTTYPSLSFKEHPAVSPPSLTGYLLALVYTYALLNDDTNVRTKRSAYSQQFTNTKGLDKIHVLLKRLMVPPFMVPLLQALYSTQDERTPKLKYVYTLACFHLLYDYGRTPPINMYFTAHDLIASKPTNRDPRETFNDWLTTQLMAQPLNLHVANYLGGLVQQNNYENWFSQVNAALFNPVTARSNTLRPTLRQMCLHPQTFEDINRINPYIHLLCLDPDNLETTSGILQDISSSVAHLYDKSVALGQIEYDTKGNQLLNHYYQNVLLPTWHQVQPSKDNFKQVTQSAYVKKMQFKTASKVNSNITLPFPPHVKNELYHPGYLVFNHNYNQQHDYIKDDLYDPITDYKGDVRHLCPIETSSEAVYFNLISGTLIECNEVTSASVPQPNPHIDTQVENSFYFQSAVPLTQIRPISLDSVRPLNLNTTPHQSKPTLPQVRIDLVNRAIDRLPIFGPNVTVPVPNLLEGYDTTPHIRSAELSCNSLCYSIKPHSQLIDIQTGTHKITAWSSYRHFYNHARDNTPLTDKIFMLLNFWTNYGTNTTLVETRHPSDCIPRN